MIIYRFNIIYTVRHALRAVNIKALLSHALRRTVVIKYMSLYFTVNNILIPSPSPTASIRVVLTVDGSICFTFVQFDQKCSYLNNIIDIGRRAVSHCDNSQPSALLQYYPASCQPQYGLVL